MLIHVHESQLAETVEKKREQKKLKRGDHVDSDELIKNELEMKGEGGTDDGFSAALGPPVHHTSPDVFGTFLFSSRRAGGAGSC